MKSLQEGCALTRVEGVERLLERPAAPFEPVPHGVLRLRMQANDGAAPVGGVFAALDEPVVLELAGQLARGGQGQAERRGELRDRLRALGADVGEQSDMPPAERRLAAGQRQQFAGRAPARPQTAHHATQCLAQLRQLLLFGYHRITIIGSKERR